MTPTTLASLSIKSGGSTKVVRGPVGQLVSLSIVTGGRTRSVQVGPVGPTGADGPPGPSGISLTIRAFGTTSTTLQASDATGRVESTGSAPATVTIPPHSSVPFAVGTFVEIGQVGTGQVTVAAGAGVTLDGVNASTFGQWSTIGVLQRATNEWVIGVAAAQVTTKGDLLVANATPSLQRVGVGVDGNVLIADSTKTEGVKWGSPSVAAITPYASFHLHFPFTVPNATWTTVDWDQLTYQSSGALAMYDGIDTTKLTVPTGYGGLYRLSAQLEFDGWSTGTYRKIRFTKNGATVLFGSEREPGSGVINDPLAVDRYVILAEGDYITVDAEQDRGSSATVKGDNDGCWSKFEAVYIQAT